MGTRARATNPRSEPAQLTPRALNMYMLKRGKTAPAMDRRKVFAAMAEAALINKATWVSKEVRAREERGNEDIQHEISVNEVIERLEEDRQKPKPGKETRKCGYDPMRLRFVS